MELRKTFRFEASHILPRHKGKCSRLHGHSWVLHVFVEGHINEETGFVKDYAEISEVVKPLIEDLDHHHLGAWDQQGVENLEWVNYMPVNPAWKVRGLPIEFYPSSENLLVWIGGKLKEAGLDWAKIAIEETCTSYAELRRYEFEGYGKASGNI